MLKLYFNKSIERIKQRAGEDAVKAAVNNRLNIEATIAARSECVTGFNFRDPNVRVFSIERVDYGTLNERTVIGYYLQNEIDDPEQAKTDSKGSSKFIHEWYVLLSREGHNKLVEQWHAYNTSASNVSNPSIKSAN
jgi:hypothetical protein